MQAIEDLRIAKGYTQAQMAAVLNVLPTHYSEYKTGVRHPSYSVLKRAYAIGLPAAIILGYGRLGQFLKTEGMDISNEEIMDAWVKTLSADRVRRDKLIVTATYEELDILMAAARRDELLHANVGKLRASRRANDLFGDGFRLAANNLQDYKSVRIESLSKILEVSNEKSDNND